MWTKEVWNDTKGKEEFEKRYEPPHCVVLDSEYCSMGRMIAIRACEKSGYTYYGAEELLELAGAEGFNIEKLSKLDSLLSAEGTKIGTFAADKEIQELINVFEKAVELALQKGPCLVHERTVKELVERKGFSCISVMTYATEMKSKLVRVKVDPKYKSISIETELMEVIKGEDRKRRNYHNMLSENPWGQKETYDLLLDAETLGMDKCISLLATVMER